jgi:hypothetical protein
MPMPEKTLSRSELPLIIRYTACRLLVIFLRFYMADDILRQNGVGFIRAYAILPKEHEQRITRKEDRATLKLHTMPISSAGYKPAVSIGKTYETPASKYRCRQRTIRMGASAQLALCRQRPSHRGLLSLSEGADPLSGPICMGVRSPTENDRRSDSVCS